MEVENNLFSASMIQHVCFLNSLKIKLNDSTVVKVHVLSNARIIKMYSYFFFTGDVFVHIPHRNEYRGNVLLVRIL